MHDFIERQAELLSPKKEYISIIPQDTAGFSQVRISDLCPGDLIRLPLSHELYYLISVAELTKPSLLHIALLACSHVQTIRIYKSSTQPIARLELREIE